MMDGVSGGPAHPGQPPLAAGNGPLDGARHPGQPTSTSAIVESALDEAAQTLFSAADVPLARTDELLAAVSGAAVKSILEMRIEQIVKHGHSAENDDMLPLGWLPKEARETLTMAADNLWGPKRDLAVARRRFVRAAAFVLAAIDRLDREVAAGGEEG